jgi:hypothetical protein
VAELFAALIHYPVLDRRGRIVTSAITSLDLHDLARSARTYELRAVFIVHPIPEQREFARNVIDHWRIEPARNFDSRRIEALETLRIVPDLDQAIAEASGLCDGIRPLLVHTSARTAGATSAPELRASLEAPDVAPAMLLFGTGFGLAPAVMERADIVLDGIRGPGDYNHLSVRAAFAIILDRLRGL